MSDHLLYFAVHRVFKLRFRDNFVVELSASVLDTVDYGSVTLLPEVLVLFEMKYVEEGLISILFLEVWTYNDAKEWKTLPLKLNLLLIVSLQILK